LLIACLSAWGVLQGFEPDDETTTLLLQIDSSFVNAVNYQDNALDWLDWLGGSERPSPLYPICRRMLTWSPRVLLERFRHLASRFQDLGLKPRSQASVKDPLDPEQWRRAMRLVNWFEERTGWQPRFAELPSLPVLRFETCRMSRKPTKKNFLQVLAQEPFSYAIIASGPNGLNSAGFAKG